MPRVRASRLWLRSVAPLVLAGVSLLALGCGDDSGGGGRLLSQEQAGDLQSTLSRVEQDVTERNCTGAGEQVATLESQIDSISRLNRSLRRSLRASVRRLETLVTNACDTSTETQTETTPTTPETGPTGETGTTGEEGDEQPPPDEEQQKEKQPKENKKGKVPPGQQNEGGGAGLPGESKSNGSGGQE
jgi:hypothetical protein